MYNPIFANWQTLLLGGLTGLVFGFLLQKGKVTRYETIVGQFLLKDFTVLKVMLTAMAVGSVGIYGMLQLGMIQGLDIKATHAVNNLAGGVIFGIGMAILGYCPGTGVAAIGDGARDAVPGVLGMLVGAGIYAETHAWISKTLTPIGDMGKVTFADITGLTPWIFVAILSAAAIVMWRLLRTKVTGQNASPMTPQPQA